MRYHHQKVYLLLTIIILVLLIGIFIYVYRMILYRHRMTEKSITEKLHHYMQLHEQRSQLERHLHPNEEMKGTEELDGDTTFMNLLFECILKHLANSEFNVEMLASELGMSRVQLYRKGENSHRIISCGNHSHHTPATGRTTVTPRWNERF